jgi:hypothetical protein
MLHATGPTHAQGGTLDAVITRSDVGCPAGVTVVDVGLSDHHLLEWAVPVRRVLPPTAIVSPSSVAVVGHRSASERHRVFCPQ